MIIRSRPKTAYTVIPNATVRDKELPDAAGWLLINLLSNTDDWSVTVKSLEADGRFGGHEKIVKNLKILRALGYARLTRLARQSIWDITDTKGEFGNGSENRNDEAGSRSENQNSENRNAYRKNICKEVTGEEKKNPPNPPKGEAVGFTEFWLAYPKKANKPAAEKAFRKLSPNAEFLAKIINDVKARTMTPDWKKQGGQFIPHPSTYLNQHGWENPISAANSPDRVETMDECAKRLFGRLYDDLTGRQMDVVDLDRDRQRAGVAA